MKRIISMLVTVAVLALALAAYAAGGCAGKVTKVEGDKVTVTATGAVPAWAKKGATVSALGGSPKILEVKGKEITLKMNKEKAAKVKVDAPVTLNKASGEMQGC